MFQKDKERALDFKKTLRGFSDDSIQNHFFYSVIYEIMYQKSEKAPELEFAAEVLGRDFFLKLKEIEPDTILDHTIFGFFDRCIKMNKTLSEFGYFLKFYKRRNKFRYQLRQKLKSKNEMRAELSTCVIQKFNGYDLLRIRLQHNEKKNLIPIDIVYELTLDIEKLIYCTRNSCCISDLL